MPIPLENPVVEPNAVMVPQITLHTRIEDGAPKTAVTVLLQAARCDDGVWSQSVGPIRILEINDIANLPEDLASLSAGIQAAYASVLSLVGQANAIRKVF